MFVYFFLSFSFSQLCLSQTHSQLILSSSHLSVSPFLKTLSSSLSQTLTSLSHHHRPDSILNVTAHQSSMSPTHQSPHFVELPSRWSASDPRRRFIWVWFGFLVGLITVAFVNCGWSSGLLVGLIIVGFFFSFLIGCRWWIMVVLGFDGSVGDVGDHGTLPIRLSLIWVFGWVDHCGFCQLWMI